jgi:hypothetical protein
MCSFMKNCMVLMCCDLCWLADWHCIVHSLLAATQLRLSQCANPRVCNTALAVSSVSVASAASVSYRVKGLKVSKKYCDKELGLKIIVLRVFRCVKVLKYFLHPLCFFVCRTWQFVFAYLFLKQMSLLTFYSPVVTSLSIKKLNVLPTQCIYVLWMDLRTNSVYFTVQH